MSIPRIESIYNLLLTLYPKEYRVRYGEEMYQIFTDMNRDRTEPFLHFVTKAFTDTGVSVFYENFNSISKNPLLLSSAGYIRLNVYNIIGGILLLPLISVLCFDIMSRILQKNFQFPNQAAQHWLNSTPLYSDHVIKIWVFFFPVFAILINVVPILQSKIKKRNGLFTVKNLVSIAIIALASFFIIVIKFHDFAPCVVHNVLEGKTNMQLVLNSCKKA